MAEYLFYREIEQNVVTLSVYFNTNNFNYSIKEFFFLYIQMLNTS